jgi:hypothetical protein
MRIDGGSGNDDSGSLIIAVEDMASVSSSVFKIKDAAGCKLQWDTAPADVARNVDFSVAISGGTAGQVVRIKLSSLDSNDRLYIGGVDQSRVFLVTLDGAGEYSASNWSVRGGSSDGWGVFTAEDTDENCESGDSVRFSITGDAFATLSSLITIGQTLLGNVSTCEIYKEGSVGPSLAFKLGVKVLDVSGEIDTGFDGYGTIICEDALGNTIQFLDAGAQAQNYGNFITVPIISGEWSYDGTMLELVEETVDPLLLTLAIPINEDADSIEDTLSVTIGVISFVVSTVANTARNSDFVIRIQAINELGLLETDYVPDGDVTIGLLSTDLSDVIVPATTDNTGWVDGMKEVTCQIQDGTGTQSGTISIIDPDTGRIGQIEIAIAASKFEYSHVQVGGYYGYAPAGDDEPPYVPVDCTNEAATLWLQMQGDSDAAFLADTVLGTGGSGSSMPLYKRSLDLYSYVYGYSEQCGGYTKYYIPPADRVGIKAARLYCAAYATRIYTQGVGVDWNEIFSEIVNNWTLKIALNESGAAFASGLELANMVADSVIPFSWLNSEQIRAGAYFNVPYPGASEYVPIDMEIPIDKNPIINMVGDYLYVWCYIAGAENIPYYSEACDCSDGVFWCQEEVTLQSRAAWPGHMKLRLYR